MPMTKYNIWVKPWTMPVRRFTPASPAAGEAGAGDGEGNPPRFSPRKWCVTSDAPYYSPPALPKILFLTFVPNHSEIEVPNANKIL